MPFARFPIPSKYMDSSPLVPHSSLKSSPLPIHPPNSSHQIPHILYIIRCNRTKPLRRKGKFSAEKATKRVFFPFQALVCRRPHICPSTFSKMSLHFVPPPVPPVTKIDNISSILPLIRKPSKVILRPSEYHPKAIRKTTKNHPKCHQESFRKSIGTIPISHQEPHPMSHYKPLPKATPKKPPASTHKTTILFT